MRKKRTVIVAVSIVAVISSVAAVTSLTGPKWAEVKPTVETTPVHGLGDDADDPCIWVHPTTPSKSAVLGTDKENGLCVYDLAGAELQFIEGDRMNSVDVRYNFPLGDGKVDLVTASNRSSDSIAVYKINPATRLLEDVSSRLLSVGVKVYGSCMYRSEQTGRYYFIVTSKLGEVEQWELFDNGAGRVDAKLVRRLKLSTQLEGCVADDELARLYIGEEDKGVWKFGAEPDDGAERVLVAETGKHLKADVEGLTVYYAGDRTGYLIVSSQGNNTFVVYEREGDNRYVATFKIGSNKKVDGAESTDGIDVVNVDLGPRFPRGMFVAHDGHNRGSKSTNYKLVPWESIARAMQPPLKIDTSRDPRGPGAGIERGVASRRRPNDPPGH